MANEGKLKVLRQNAPIDPLIAYVTDAQPQTEKLHGFLAGQHPSGPAFADAVTGAGANLLAASAEWDKEKAEAIGATKVQSAVVGRGVEVIRAARRTGRYVASELDQSGELEDLVLARKVETATTVGVRADLRRQTSVRRLLTALVPGLTEISDVLATWNAPADLLQRAQSSLADIEEAIKDQSREQLEADMAYDRVEVEAAHTVRSLNRIIRLLNGNSERVPEASWTAFRSLEGDHPEVFYRPPSPAAPDDGDAGDTGEADQADEVDEA